MANGDDGRRSKVQEHLANERTLLSWVRLSLAIVALGFVVARFGLFIAELFILQHATTIETGWSVPIGVVLILAGPIFAVLALLRFRALEQEIEAERLHAHHGLIYAMIIATVLTGAGLSLYLIVVAGTVSR